MLGFRGALKWNRKARNVLRDPKPGERPPLQQSICYRDVFENSKALGRSCW